MIYNRITLSLLSATRPPKVFWNRMVARGYHATKSGPPKYPQSNIDLAVFGGGFILTICVLPLWATRQVPKWSEIHNKTN